MMAARSLSVIYLLRYVISVYLESIINNPDLDPSIHPNVSKVVVKSDPLLQGAPLLFLRCPLPSFLILILLVLHAD